MKTVSKERVSRFRREIARLTEELKARCLKAAHVDLIFQGTPQEVYRRCGKANCRCATGDGYRHGPYRVIHTRREGKQRQISLKQSEQHYYQMAQHYQYQYHNRLEIQHLQSEILEQVDKMLRERTIWEKEKK
jgi:hypothetical protein